ncbi:MAG: 16S rRNA (guanine(966)-N(2))-methyltransferase RsmD [Candidatus Sericytochromatia bacterium]|nr:16S rRNA (guanine(966)-N(2))-methyltransferase RsmD [Candidatus Sericytochromatia bacterium]
MLKIVGGSHRGRRLKWLDIPEIRPTPARVREAVFNILADRVPDSNWWDLCCGSGVVGLEALSHGAASVVFVEQNPRSLRLLRENIHTLELQAQTRLQQQDLRRFLHQQKQLSAAFVYCDPPYESPLYQPVVERLAALPLAEGLEQVTLILEYRRRQASWTLQSPWQLVDTREYGDTCLAFLERQA